MTSVSSLQSVAQGFRVSTIRGKEVGLADLYKVPKVQQHVATVMSNAERIARRLGFTQAAIEKQVLVAALFHDATKDINRRGEKNTEGGLLVEVENNLGRLESLGIWVDRGVEGHTTNKWIAHAPTSALLAHDEYGIRDIDVLRAIAHHQVGMMYCFYGNMSTLEKVIMLADYIDKQEKPYEALAMKTLEKTDDIDLALLVVLTGTVETELTRTDKIPTPNGNLIMMTEELRRVCLWKGETNFVEAHDYLAKTSERIRQLSVTHVKDYKNEEIKTLFLAFLEEARDLRGQYAQAYYPYISCID